MGRAIGSPNTNRNFAWLITRTAPDGTKEYQQDDKSHSWEKAFLEGKADDLTFEGQKFKGLRYFDTREEAEELLKILILRQNRTKNGLLDYTYTITRVLDTVSYMAIQDYLDEDTFDGIIALLKKDTRRAVIIEKYGAKVTPATVSEMRVRYRLFKSAGFGTYKKKS